MRLRIELFVDDVDASIRFYQRALRFRVARREAEYASLELGDAVLGPRTPREAAADGQGPGFTRARLAGVRGAGVEIVLEVPDVDAAGRAVEEAGYRLVEPPRERPWGFAISASSIPTAITCGSRTPDAARRASER